MLYKKTEVCLTTGTWMMATSCVVSCWCFLTCKRLMQPTPKLEQNGTNRKQTDLAAALLEWNINALELLLPQQPTSHLELQWDPVSVSQSKLLAKADVTWAMHERMQLCQDPRTEFVLILHRVHGHTLLMKDKLPQSLIKSVKGRSKDSSQVLPRTVRNKPHSAPANQVLATKRSADVARPAHLVSLVAVIPLQQLLASCQSNLCLRDWTH